MPGTMLARLASTCTGLGAPGAAVAAAETCAGPTLPKGEAPGAAVEVLPEGWVMAADVDELVMGRLSNSAMLSMRYCGD